MRKTDISKYTDKIEFTKSNFGAKTVLLNIWNVVKTLLCICLVTGVIASSINLMATMPGNIFLFVLIFIVGHTINIAINLIGTYVHTNRLQYVEFFSKFYHI